MIEKRSDDISLMNVTATAAVVMLHTNGVFWTFSRERYWFTANILESVLYFAVPLFFLISGATLFDYRKRYDTRTFFKKRIQKTVIPFFLWSLIGLLWCLYTGSVSVSELSVDFVLNGILYTRFIGIYWFFIPLFLVYLSMPLFAALDERYKKETLTYLAVAGFVLNIVLPFADALVPSSLYSGVITVSAVSGYLLYPVIGYLISHNEIGRTGRYIIYVLGVLGLLMHICGTYFLSMSAGEIVSTFKGYNNVPCMLYSTAVFVFAKYACRRISFSDRFCSMIQQFSGYTFSIYLTHWYVMCILNRIVGISTQSIVWRVGAPFVIIALCVLMIWLGRKIPVVRRLFP